MTLIFEASWADYEEGARITVMQDEHGAYHVHHSGYCVMTGEYDTEYLATEDMVYEIMEEWLDLEDI